MRKPNWYDAVIWASFTIIGFLGPVVVGLGIRIANGTGVTLESIAGQGQFAVSSAGLLLTTSYFVARPGSLARLPLTEWFMLSSIAGLVLGIFFFVLATLTLSGDMINTQFYLVPSIVLFAVAFVIAFIAVGLDRARDITEPRYLEENTRAQREQIEESFDATFS